MDRSVARSSTKLAPVMMIVGATAVLLGSVLPWFELQADFSSLGGTAVRTTTASGLDTSDGTIFLVLAVAIAALGVLVGTSAGRGTRRGVSAIAGLGSLFVVGIAIYDAITPKAQAIDEASKEVGSGVGAAAIKRFIEGLFDRGFITIGVEVGLWIVIVGAAVALIGSLLAVTARSEVTPPVGPPFAASASGEAIASAPMPVATAPGPPAPPAPPPPAPVAPSAEPAPPPTREDGLGRP
jgi:hypothetical protein